MRAKRILDGAPMTDAEAAEFRAKTPRSATWLTTTLGCPGQTGSFAACGTFVNGISADPWNQAVEVGNSTRGCRSRRVTGLLSGGLRSRTQSPKRRIVRVMYGVIVARSSVSTG
jgi:hypothetical protein